MIEKNGMAGNTLSKIYLKGAGWMRFPKTAPNEASYMTVPDLLVDGG